MRPSVYRLARQRSIGLALLFIVFSFHFGFAQNQDDVLPGVIRIKVSEGLARQLENARFSHGPNQVVSTGIPSLDNVNQRFNAHGIKRVFPYVEKFEAKHRKYGLHRWYEIELDETNAIQHVLPAFRSIQNVEIAEPVYKKMIIGSDHENFGPVVLKNTNTTGTLPGTSNDPLLVSQWHYNNTGQTGGTPGSDINLLNAWQIETGNPNVVVSVHDGGIQVNHVDIAANMWINTGEIPGNGIDDDNNGYIDDVFGYGFGDNTGTIAPDPHGTHVGGTIAAVSNNEVGVAGIAGGTGSGDGVRLMSLAVFGATANGGFATSYIYAADNGATISQNSWGYTLPNVFEQVVLDAIDYFIAEAGRDEFGNQVGPMNGGIVIFAAGNSNSSAAYYPGFYSPTFAVAGTTHQDKKAWYSNFGSWVDIAAPGGETSGVPAQQGVLSTLTNNNYGFFQGTSMACPHVSGVAALLVSRFGGPGFTPQALRTRIMQTADNIDEADPPFAGLLGAGRINAFAALQQDDETPPEAIIDLSVHNVAITSITLTWTAPFDPGNASATAYDIRYSTSPINDSNFDEATPATGPPSPKPAGMTETFEVTGLLPGTLYYFAIKSADFFGNVSGISNVVEQATNFAPAIVVSPTSFTANLQTAGNTTQTLTIFNTGQGPLEFTFTNVTEPGNFAVPSPVSGVVQAGESFDVNVEFSASGLLAGTYQQNLSIASNDPLNSILTVPTTLHVTNNGAPIASVQPGNLNFGGVLEGGSKSLTVAVHNAGSDTLTITAITSDNADFTGEFTGAINVSPFEEVSITVIYTATSLGNSAGTVSIHTNDPVNPALFVSVAGEGLEAPGIMVSPDALFESLNTGTTSTQILTVENTGASDLEFSIKVSTPGSGTASVKQVSLPSSEGVSSGLYGEKQTAFSTSNPSRELEIKSVGTLSVASKVLIISPDNDVNDLATILNGFEDVEADIFPKASLPGISLADLVGYDVVLTTNNTQWLSSGNISPVVIGNLLADYIDQGGKVIVNQFAYSFDAWRMEGRFITEQYGPFMPSTTEINTTVSMIVVAPDHPVMEGVSTLQYSGFVQNVSLAPGATLLANWTQGGLFLAVNENVVGLNMLPSLGNGGPLQWVGDLPTLYHNAIRWFSGPSYVTVNPTEGIVSPGNQVQLEVTFDATGLTGGVYAASIDITNNVPGQELVSIPVELTVLGPQFTVTPDSLHQQLNKGQTATQTLVLSNNGSGDHAFEIRIEELGLAPVGVARQPVNGPVAGATSEPFIPERMSKVVSPYADANGISALLPANALPSATSTLYATDFEEFALGNINGQNGWSGQFGNWRVETFNPSSGQKHFRGLSDGFGQSLSFSPVVAIGSEPKSTATMKLNRQGSGVTWQVIPQSPAAGLVNTRVQFNPDGSSQALVSDGAGGAFFAPISASVPTGYFDLTIEVNRSTFVFDIYYNDNKVFTGQGFAGDIQQVVVLSLMQVAGPTFDMDDFQILDGTREVIPPYLSVSPLSGNLAAGQSIELTVSYDATALEFGTYLADIIIDIGGIEQLVVPTTLAVIGDPAIDVEPTVLQATAEYKETTSENFEIKNIGGMPLHFSMQVVGADTDVNNLPELPVSKFSDSDPRIKNKLAEDVRLSRAVSEEQPSVIQVMTGVALLEEKFEGGSFPPSGWNVIDNAGTGVVWRLASQWGEGNYCGTGEAATASSDAAGPAEFDTELWTPIISTQGYKNIVVQYNVNYQNFANFDFLDLDILVEGSSTWENVLRWNDDHGTFRGTGEFVSLALDAYLGDASSFRLRWHYYDPNTGDWDWYAQIDDVVILGDPRAWLTVSPASGTVPVRGAADITANFDSEDLDPGFYVAGILVNSNAANKPLVGVVALLDVLNPAEIQVSPGSLHQELVSGHMAAQSLTITNTGESSLKFSFPGITAPASSEQTGLERFEPLETRSSASIYTADLLDFTALQPGDFSKNVALELYATGFEEFSLGDINNQQGWAGQWGNWTIETINPQSGTRHFRGLSDGFGLSLAFSPVVGIGTDAISSTTMQMNLNSTNVTWQIIPQSPTAQRVNTRFEMSPNGTLRALVSDGMGGAFYQPIAATLPAGYFEFRIDVERATSQFTIYVDGNELFTGQGFAGDIEQVVVFSLMEVANPTLDIDNLAILDGSPVAPWLFVDPVSGTVPGGGSLTATVTFDARELEGGLYEDVLTILSNDPLNHEVHVPVTLAVTPPPVIQVDPDSLSETLMDGEISVQQLTISNTGVADLTFAFLGYTSTADVAARNNTSRIYPDDFQVGKNEADLRKGHPVLFGNGGPDGSGYTWIDSNEPGGPVFQWIDITESGTSISLGDDASVTVSLPFTFDFYNVDWNVVTIGSNGYLTFGSSGSAFFNTEIPNPALPNNLIAPFWDDLFPPAAGAMIHYRADADKFIVQYTNMPYFLSDLRNTFQVILYANGTIRYQYLNMNDRQSATIGIENSDGSDGLQVAFNTTYIQNNLAIQISRGLPWATPQPVSGTISGGSSQVIDVQFSSVGVAPGNYEGALQIISNDLKSPLVSVPVTLTVIENKPPVLGALNDTLVVETESVVLTFTATDEDDPEVFVSLTNPPSFATLVSSTNGMATYAFNPQLGHAGSYALTIAATDTRGRTTSGVFELSVIPYGVESFSLINLVTGEVLAHFIEGITLNSNDLDYNQYAVRANTNPPQVGSVQFKVNNKKRNVANAPPYLFGHDANEPLFDKTGMYVLKAEAYVQKSGKGNPVQSRETVIEVINQSQTFALVEDELLTVKLYPVPIERELNLELSGSLEGEIELIIQNYFGQVVYRTRGSVASMERFVLDTNSLGLGIGMYYLQIAGEDGFRKTIRFSKQ
jgi:subtilisin family serine protease